MHAIFLLLLLLSRSSSSNNKSILFISYQLCDINCINFNIALNIMCFLLFILFILFFFFFSNILNVLDSKLIITEMNIKNRFANFANFTSFAANFFCRAFDVDEINLFADVLSALSFNFCLEAAEDSSTTTTKIFAKIFLTRFLSDITMTMREIDSKNIHTQYIELQYYSI